MTTRTRLGLAAAALLFAGLVAWAVRESGPAALGGPVRVELGEASALEIDTVAVRRRAVTASLDAHVVGTLDARTVEVADRSGIVRVVLRRGHGLDVGDALLVVGRVREDRLGRRVDAVAWSRLEPRAGVAESPPAPVVYAPDTPDSSDAAPVRLRALVADTAVARPDLERQAQLDSLREVARFRRGVDRSGGASDRSAPTR